MRDWGTSALAAAKPVFLTRIAPWSFHVGQIAQPLRRLLSIELKNGIDCLALIAIQQIGVAVRMLATANCPRLRVIEFPNHRAIRPRLDRFLKERFVIPNQRQASE